MKFKFNFQHNFPEGNVLAGEVQALRRRTGRLVRHNWSGTSGEFSLDLTYQQYLDLWFPLFRAACKSGSLAWQARVV